MNSVISLLFAFFDVISSSMWIWITGGKNFVFIYTQDFFSYFWSVCFVTGESETWNVCILIHQNLQCTRHVVLACFLWSVLAFWSCWLPALFLSRKVQESIFEVEAHMMVTVLHRVVVCLINHLNAELNPICHLLALLGAHHFLHVSRIRVKSLTLRLLMSYIYGAPILDVSRSHTTQHSR